MGVFGAIKEAVKAQKETSNYIAEGRHQLEVLACRKLQSKDNYTCFILEGKVVESSTHKVGEAVSRVIKLNPRWESYYKRDLAEIAQIVAACAGEDPTSVEESDVEAVCAPENPLAGRTVRVTAVPRMSQKTGKTRLSFKWSQP